VAGAGQACKIVILLAQVHRHDFGTVKTPCQGPKGGESL